MAAVKSSAAPAYPEVVGELQGKDGDAFVVERAGHGARDVARHNGDEAGRQQAGALVPQLPGQEEGGDGGQAAEHRRQEHAHVADVDGDVEQVEHVVDEARRGHQTRVHLEVATGGGERRSNTLINVVWMSMSHPCSL